MLHPLLGEQLFLNSQFLIFNLKKQSVCKPGSVFDSHLSTRRVAAVLQPPRERSGQPIAPIPVLLRIEFTASDTLEPMGELLPRLSILTACWGRRSISVALFLRSLWAGVTRYPCPVEPGLSSRTAFRLVPAAVRPARPTILHILPHRVKSGSDLFSCNRHE